MSMIQIALTGLNANRIALDTTSQNVANVNTPGYSRQQALFSSVGSGLYDRQSAGSGVTVSNIRRVADTYLTKQMWSSNTQASFFQRHSSDLGQLEKVLGAEGLSISSGMNKLYAALNDATVKPESIPLRQQVLSEADALAKTFNSLSNALYNQHKDLHGQRMAAVSQVNSLLGNIADVNAKIVDAGNSGGAPAKLLDQRDELIGELSKHVDVRLTDQQDGSIQISLKSGQPLVLGTDAATLNATPTAADPFMVDWHIDFSGQAFQISGKLGASLGAISEFQTDTLKPFRHALNDMAQQYADRFNAQLATGSDLHGTAGAPLFHYDPAYPAATLKVTGLTADQLAFSSDGNVGNSDVLKTLVDIHSEDLPVTGFGSVTINEAFAAIVGKTAIISRQANSDAAASKTLFDQAKGAKENLSSVNRDEEAANLMTFANAYQANMKVIGTANKMFDTVLQLF